MIDGANENDNENEYMKQQLTAIRQQLKEVFIKLRKFLMTDYRLSSYGKHEGERRSASGRESKKWYLLLAKIQLWLAQTNNNVWSVESVQSDGIMDIITCWFLEIYYVVWKIFFTFATQMD